MKDQKSILSEYEKSLKDLWHVVIKFSKTENNDEINYIKEKINVVRHDFKDIEEHLSNKDWELKKVRTHEYYNSILLAIPTAIAVFVLGTSLFSNHNKPSSIERFEEPLVLIQKDTLEKQNLQLKDTVKVLRDSIKNLNRQK